jgi:lipopolysaccharide/colanic/teichoic acid biosynthesis glycosyltransferase
VCIILLFTGEHEIFYFQKRIGKKGNPFMIWKFATMLKNSPHIGTGTITLQHDNRVLPVGRFLRKTKINELPQLVNILKGDMSFIGPRPLTEDTYNAYSGEVRKCISQLRPGLSGVGSIVFRNEEYYISKATDPAGFYNEQILPAKGELEIWYFHNRSVIIDLVIMLITCWVIFFPNSTILYRIFKDLPEFNPKPE